MQVSSQRSRATIFFEPDTLSETFLKRENKDSVAIWGVHFFTGERERVRVRERERDGCSEGERRVEKRD